MKNVLIVIVVFLVTSCCRSYSDYYDGTLIKIEDVNRYYERGTETLVELLKELKLEGRRTVVVMWRGNDILLTECDSSYRLIYLQSKYYRQQQYVTTVFNDTIRPPQLNGPEFAGKIRYDYIYPDTFVKFKRLFESFPARPLVYDYYSLRVLGDRAFCAMVDSDGTILMRANSDSYYASLDYYNDSAMRKIHDNHGASFLFYDLICPGFLNEIANPARYIRRDRPQ